MAKDDAYGKKTLPKGHPKRGEWQISKKNNKNKDVQSSFNQGYHG